ncbi:transglutaminase family protein [Lacibacter sp. MH-610]|uniref:transglutaminase family protein n=1 Tax=Lacibacter sp. MH-610 TaxID=3020883 RepID=UPI0038929B9C
MPVFKIHHVTKYTYNRPVIESVNQVRIYPVASPQQEILNHEITISDAPELFFFLDYWGNRCADFSIPEPHKELQIDSRLIVRTTGVDKLPDDNSTLADMQTVIASNFQLLELSKPEEIKSTDAIHHIISSITADDKTVMQLVEHCSAYIFQNFKYIKGITTIETTVDEILEHRSGVCQDFAHVLLQLLRTIGIPARYVSGYICPNKNGMRGEGATHAWVEAFIPHYGWMGIDPTNNVWVSTHHVKLAVGRNFNDCSPMKGTFKGISRQTLSVYVSVGYEDGHVFEEINDVQMEVTEMAVTADLLAAEEAQQQQ